MGMKVVRCYFSVKKLGLMIKIIFGKILSKFTYFPHLHTVYIGYSDIGYSDILDIVIILDV